MSKPNSNPDDGTSTEAADPPPGRADHGRVGGMATREVAPHLAEKSDE